MRPSKHASLITAAAVGVVALIWGAVAVQRDLDDRLDSARRENHLIYSNVSQLVHRPDIDFATLEDEEVESPLGRLESQLVSAEVFLADGTMLFPATTEGDGAQQVPPKQVLRGARISTFIEPSGGDEAPAEASKNFFALITTGDLKGEEWGPLKAQDGKTIGAIRIVTDMSYLQGDLVFTTALHAGLIVVVMIIGGFVAGYAAGAAADSAVFGAKPPSKSARKAGRLPWNRRPEDDEEPEANDPLVATDPLTGLLTHKETHASLEREVTFARKERRPLSVVMADIDDFRALNSGYGADVGDELLKMVGEAIRWLSRSHGGVACRFGSDEFVAILPGKDEIGATEFVQGIEARLRTLKFPAETRYPVTLRVSAGTATLSGDVETAQELLAFAETAMRESRGRHDREFEAELRPAVGDTIRRTPPHIESAPIVEPRTENAAADLRLAEAEPIDATRRLPSLPTLDIVQPSGVDEATDDDLVESGSALADAAANGGEYVSAEADDAALEDDQWWDADEDGTSLDDPAASPDRHSRPSRLDW